MSGTGIERDERFEALERCVLCRGPVVSVIRARSRLPNGHVVEQDIVGLPAVVAVLPLIDDPVHGSRVVLVRQFRTAVEGFIHEVPAGHLELDAAGVEEDPASCARRELEEETGYAAEKVTHLATRLVAPGLTDQRMHFFLAEALRRGRQDLEPSECLDVVEVSLAELLEEVLCGGSERRVVDTKTHLTLLHAAILKGWSVERGRVLRRA